MIDKILTSSKMSSNVNSPQRVTTTTFKMNEDTNQKSSKLEDIDSPRDQDYSMKMVNFKKMRRENFDPKQFDEINNRAIEDKNALMDKMDVVNMQII